MEQRHDPQVLGRLRRGPALSGKPILLIACVLSALLAADGRAQSLVVRGGTLIDGTGRPPIEDARIIVRDGIIVEVGRSAPSSGASPIIDAREKYIVPGLVDSHIHYRDWETEPFLAFGVTTVNDLGNPFQWQIALKHGFNSGRMRLQAGRGGEGGSRQKAGAGRSSSRFFRIWSTRVSSSCGRVWRKRFVTRSTRTRTA